MDNPVAGFVIESVGTGGCGPDIVDGGQVGEFRGLEPKGPAAHMLDVCLWRSDPATYDFEKDEAFHVVAGVAAVELSDTRETIERRVGDVADFVAGTRSVRTITQPFKKFVVTPS